MKYLFAFALLLSFCALSAQSFTVPQDAKFEAAEDYAAQHDNIIAAVNYLESTPPNQDQANRQRVQAYLLQWLTGTPSVTLGLDQEIVTFMEEPHSFMLYMGAYSRYCLENNSKDAVAANVAAIQSVLDFYAKNKAVIGKQKGLEKYQKLADKGKLEATLKKLTKG